MRYSIRYVYLVLIGLCSFLYACSENTNPTLKTINTPKSESLVDSLFAQGKLKNFNEIIDKSIDSSNFASFDHYISFRSDSLYLKMMKHDWALLFVGYYLNRVDVQFELLGLDSLNYQGQITTYTQFEDTYNYVAKWKHKDSFDYFIYQLENVQPNKLDRSGWYIDGWYDMVYYNGDSFYYINSLDNSTLYMNFFMYIIRENEKYFAQKETERKRKIQKSSAAIK